jgi:aminoglycoside phosphotransferase
MPSTRGRDELDLPGALTPEAACRQLTAEFGLKLRADQVSVERRDDRWLVRLPGRQLAWFAANAAARGRLAQERRVLRLLEARCTFAAPRVLHASDAAAVEVRSMVPGNEDVWAVYAALQRDPALAAALGGAVGAILAEQHTRIVAADVAGWLPRRTAWPEAVDWIAARLPTVVEDKALVTAALSLVERYERVVVAEADTALVHGDLGLHNIGIDLAAGAVHGVFDYEGAAWADRHHDFRYLVLDTDRDELFDAAAAVYERATQRPIERERVLLYNAACAVTFLADRAGTRPEERPCGRTLVEDLRWSRYAIARARQG